MKGINAIKTQLVVTTGTNLFQHRMPRNLKLSQRKRGEDIDITSYSDNDEDELEIL